MSKDKRKRNKHRLGGRPKRKACNKKKNNNTSFDDAKTTAAEVDWGSYYNQPVA